MKKTNLIRIVAFILCVVLVAAMALVATGCKNATGETPETTVSEKDTAVKNDKETDPSDPAEDDIPVEEDSSKVLGEGETQFTFTVVDGEGNETVFTVNTDKKIVGEALLELDLIEGEDGDYGLYVKKVNGIVADYDVDQTYWAFYVNGEYAMSGVDTTEIEDGATYSFKIEK